MKRLHIHVGVEDLDGSIRFYNTLFGAEPVKTRPDYAKWLLDDPRVNFAISTRAGNKGVDHLGVQVENESELEEIRERLARADVATFDEGETVCCYARSDKTWAQDPAGVPWEAYHTMAEAQVYKGDAAEDGQACCAPETQGQPGCCEPKTEGEACCTP